MTKKEMRERLAAIRKEAEQAQKDNDSERLDALLTEAQDISAKLENAEKLNKLKGIADSHNGKPGDEGDGGEGCEDKATKRGKLLMSGAKVKMAAKKIFNSLLSSSTVMPGHTATDVKDTFNSVSSIVDAVKIVPLNGGESYKRGFVKSYGEGDYKTFWAYLLRNKRLTRADFRFGSYPSLVRGNYVPNGYLIRRTALQAAGPLTKEAPLEDWWLHLQLSKLGPYVFVDKPLFRYPWHGANTAANAARMNALSRQTLLCELSRVRAAGDRERLALLNRESPIRRRDLIRLGGLLALWDEADFGHKRRILRIFNRTFVLKSKN